MTAHNTLVWLDLHRQSYFCVAGGLIAIALVRTVIPLLRAPTGEDRRHDWIWGLMILGILVAGRWPTFFVTREFSEDECQLLAGARVLWHDPVFWRSVDGASSGPLNFFALWPAGALCGWHSYIATRSTALLLVAAIFILAHQCMTLVVGRRVARLAGLGAVCFEALTNSVNFLYYSTELLPMLLLTAASYAAIRRWVRSGGLFWNGLGGLLLGAAPLAKVQAVPLAAVLGLVWLVAEFRTPGADAGRRRTYLLGGAVIPGALFAFQVAVAGEWWNAFLSYFSYNRNYASGGAFPLSLVVQRMLADSLREDSLLHLYLPGVLIWFLLMVRWRQRADRATRWLMWAAFIASLIAIYSVFYPGRPFLHYWQIAILPVTLLVAALTANLLAGSIPSSQSRDRRLVAACAVVLVGAMLLQRARHPNTFIGALSIFQEYPRTELAVRIAAHVHPGESIAIWGWTNYIYVEANLLQATRDAHFERAVVPGPYCSYFRQRFLADLVHARPPLFLDSSGPCSLIYHDPKYRFDRNFPELAAVISQNYTLVDEFSGARLYRRRDLIGP